MTYREDVIDDAFEFLRYNQRDIKEAIEEETATLDAVLNGGIRDRFYEDLHSRTFSWMEAATIIENCKREEDDATLWEGLKLEDAVQACAVHSYSNDVWDLAVEFYGDLVDKYEVSYDVVKPDGDFIESFEDELDAEEFIDKQAEVIGDETIAAGLEIKEDSNFTEIWGEFVKDNTNEPEAE